LFIFALAMYSNCSIHYPRWWLPWVQRASIWLAKRRECGIRGVFRWWLLHHLQLQVLCNTCTEKWIL